MNDKDWDRVVEHIGESYNAPPATPSEAMWKSIQSEIDADSSNTAEREPRRSGVPWRWSVLLAAAAGLVLWLGFGLGRATAPNAGAGVDAGSVATAPTPRAAPRRAASQVQLAAARHLVATRSLLNEVGNDAATGALGPDVASWASRLLTDTRLILDSPAGDQTALRALLEDLELVLVQVVHASAAGAAGDTDVGRVELQQLTQGLQQNNVLPRIQQLLPPVMAGAADD